jgi:hypothetical protein
MRNLYEACHRKIPILEGLSATDSLKALMLYHTVVEVAIVVDDTLTQVDVASLTVALLVPEGGAEDGDVAVSLKCEVNFVGGMGEALTIPDEVACCRLVRAVLNSSVFHTVVVADVLIEIDLSIVPLAVGLLKTSPQDMAVINADIFGRVVEGHIG